jgi:hypothetical protein
MIDDIGADEYKIEENEKEYILRISSTDNKINLNLNTYNNKQFKNFAGEFTLDDLRRINRVFLLTPSIYDAKEEFKKAIERRKIGISERDDYIHIVFYMMIGTDTSTLSIALPRDETPRIVRLEQNLNILKLGKDNLYERLVVFEKEADEIKRDLDNIQLGNNTLNQIADTIGQGIPDVSEILKEYYANMNDPKYSSYNKRKPGGGGMNQPYSSARIKTDDVDQPYSSARFKADGEDQPYSSVRHGNKNEDQPYSSVRHGNKNEDLPYSSTRHGNKNEDLPYSSTRHGNKNEDQVYSSARINDNNEDQPYSSARHNNNEEQPYSSARINNNDEDQPYSSAKYKIDPIKESSNEQNRESSIQNDNNNNQDNYNLDVNNLEVNPSLGSNQEDKFPNGIIKNIIKEPEEIELVTNKIEEKFPGSSYKLLYKGSRDGDSAATFHSKCDEAEKTLVIVEDNYGNRFGGFTTQDWGGQYLQKKDDDAFLFSVDKNKTYDVIPNQNAIGCYPNFGPVFFGCQIRIYDNYLTKGGTTYKKGLNYRTTEDFELTNGNQNFGVRDIEVYEVESRL